MKLVIHLEGTWNPRLLFQEGTASAACPGHMERGAYLLVALVRRPSLNRSYLTPALRHNRTAGVSGLSTTLSPSLRVSGPLSQTLPPRTGGGTRRSEAPLGQAYAGRFRRLRDVPPGLGAAAGAG